MEELIKNFPRQFTFQPAVVNAEKLSPADKFIVCGLGGSHLAAGLFKIYNPHLALLIHRDYGLARVPDYFLRESLFIASSYSGNTEEVIDACTAALAANLQVAIMTSGGKLLELAQSRGLPYVVLPVGFEPRLALGFMTLGLARLIGDEAALLKLSALVSTLNSQSSAVKGEELAEKLLGRWPIIYASTVNLPLAYTWKIKFNETVKTPAFYNVLPEANHNELAGWNEKSGDNVCQPYFLFLRDETDEPRIQKRFTVLGRLLTEKGFAVQEFPLAGETWHKIFTSLILADWLTYHLAIKCGVAPLPTPLIEEFKKLVA